MNHLSAKIVAILSSEAKGKLLDLGCGSGECSKQLSDLGFQVTACDMDSGNFRFHSSISFKEAHLDRPLPFENQTFDYVIFLEVIEHIYNPNFVIAEISRILKPGGKIILSTPNILNIGSRLRFLFEGGFDFFREPTLDYSKVFPSALQNMHVVAWRYHELEYLLEKNSLQIAGVDTDMKKKNLAILAFFLKPLLILHSWSKEKRARKKGGVHYERIHQIILSDALLLGRHLILKAVKN